MTISKKLEKALNDQINREYYSAYLYLAMSVYCQEKLLPGLAKWLRVQAKEEFGHGMKLFDLLAAKNGHIELKAIEQPPSKFSSPIGAFEQALKHEQEMSRRIHGLYELAGKENEIAAQIALQWFVTEQVEEENSVESIVEKIKMIGGDRGHLILLVDKEAGSRSS